jgi:AraC-like DNA-binding protein
LHPAQISAYFSARVGRRQTIFGGDAMTTQLPIVFSTDPFPVRERFDAWRETFALAIARVDGDTPDHARFQALITARPLANLSVVENSLSPVALERRPQLLRDGDDDLSFVLCTGTPLRFWSGDAHVEIGPGEATLVDSHRRGSVRSDGDTGCLVVRVGRAHVRQLVGTRETPLLPLLKPSLPAVQLLSIYLRAFAAERQPLSAEAATIADRHMGELLAAILDPAADVVREQRFGGIKAARLRALTHLIEQRLHDPGLSAARVGASFGLSERSVQHLFAESGTTFTDLVRQKRLQRARRRLEEPVPNSIADIAYEVGFGDLSSFYRAFRRAFGCTPSDLRRRASGARVAGWA